MNKTLIEWCLNPDGSPGYTWNVITGCLGPKGDGVHCPYCYARRLANGRLKQRYLANGLVACDYEGGEDGSDNELKVALTDPFYPRFWEERLKDIERPLYPFSIWSNNNESRTKPIECLPVNRHAKRKKVGIFTCDMSDLFGIGIPEEWTRQVLDVIRTNSVDRFYLLTKQPQNLIKWSPFPENCWVGVTATEQCQFVRAVSELRFIEATIKYLSFEPLLAHIPMLPEALTLAGINWLIIGAMTGNLEDIKKMLMEYPQLDLKTYDYKRWTLQPKLEWVEEIVKAADKAGISVFLKDNLKPLLINKKGFANVSVGTMIEREIEKSDYKLRQEMPK